MLIFGFIKPFYVIAPISSAKWLVGDFFSVTMGTYDIP